jgi:hypothetical protein
MSVSLSILLASLTVSLKSNGPPFRLLSTWVTIDAQAAFDEARKVELTTQARLASYLDINGYHTQHHNAQSELIFLRAKLCRAQAEAEVCALAIENAPASNYSGSGRLNWLACYLQVLIPPQIYLHPHGQLSGRFYRKKFFVTRST